MKLKKKLNTMEKNKKLIKIQKIVFLNNNKNPKAQ